MAKMNLLQAINNALITAMTDDEKVMVFGEDVGHFGGVFRATSHLQEKFGKARCFNTPLTEFRPQAPSLGMPNRTGHHRICQWFGIPRLGACGRNSVW